MHSIVYGTGPKNCSLIIVGEQPAYNEFRAGKPFVGETGRLLDRCLAFNRIARGNCFITNVVKRSVKLNQIVKYKKATAYQPAHYEVINPILWNEALDVLEKELLQCEAKVILACGGVALFALTSLNGIGKWRGSMVDCTLVKGKKVVGTYHPATVIPPKNQHKNERLIKWDLKRAWNLAHGLIEEPDRISHLNPTSDKALAFLHHIEAEGLRGKLIGHDIEVLGKPKQVDLNKQMGCFSIGCDHEVMCIPIVKGYLPNYPLEDERKILVKYFEILENERIKKVIQNSIFEYTFLWLRYGIIHRNFEDTMIGQHHIYPHYPKGLDFICSIHTTIPYYKADGKEFLKGWHSDEEKFWMYNCLDTHALLEAWPPIEAAIKELGNEAAYRRKLSTIPALSFSERHGIKVLVELMMAAREKLDERACKIADDFQEKTGASVSSPQQVAELFYDKMQIAPPKSLGGNRSTDKKVLKVLATPTKARPAVEEAKVVDKYRKLSKMVSTYLKPEVLDPDGRFRAAAKPVGTAYSRISTGKSIFGTGMNSQNWKHNLLSMKVPDPGHLYIGGDLSQAENRITAYVAKCKKMIEAFERGEDIHATTGMVIMEQVLGEAASMELIKQPAKEIDPSLTWRDCGKRGNHSLNYDLGYVNFALHYNMARSMAMKIHKYYHAGYPEIKGIFHPYIRDCIRKTRVVETLKGHKIYFVGGLVDETYKAGYACIPQGTLGNMIDEGCSLVYSSRGPWEKAAFLHQIHDHIGFQYPLGDWKGLAKAIIELKELLEEPLISPWGTSFSIPFDIMIGTTLNKDDKLRAKEWKGAEIEHNVGWLSDLLAETYETLLPPMTAEEFVESLDAQAA